MTFTAFIETQFPVSKLSKESYKERMAGSSQTLTGLGKWWGRKPLVIVRATIIGLLLPATDDPQKDLDIFLQLMTMDEEGLRKRRDKSIPAERMAELLDEVVVSGYFNVVNGKWKWLSGVSREEKKQLQEEAFDRMGYDEKLSYCRRPEQIDGPSEDAWQNINAHCGTNATNLQEWVQQMGERQFGHTPRVGDAFCGGGSIPFEAARLGCEAYGSDLNPVAALLTWASLNIIGGGQEVQEQVTKAQQEAFEAADRQITEWGIEHNEEGWRADAYLYCLEAKSPLTGYWVPLAPSWVISEKYKVCAVLRPDHDNKRYHIEIITDADKETFKKAKEGTVQNSRLVCPETGKTFPFSTIRGDRYMDGETIYGLRQWENDDLVPRPDDTFQERLYCVRYLETYYKRWVTTNKEKKEGYWEDIALRPGYAIPKTAKLESRRHYIKPSHEDIEREEIVLKLLLERFDEWQEKGYIPSSSISDGIKTEEPKRTRGWTYWHHLFNPRQLLVAGVLLQESLKPNNIKEATIASILGVGSLVDWSSKLTRWTGSIQKSGGIGAVVAQTLYNQAFNTLYNYAIKPFNLLGSHYFFNGNSTTLIEKHQLAPTDARNIKNNSSIWITDPPYADAVNYHEVGDFFLAWYEKHLPRLFPEWYTDCRAALAVKGKGQGFNRSMVEVYRNLTNHMPDNGAQVVMFTHQDASVWADLALILWASGLRVTAAWTIQTETDAGGIKKGNYVQGTVLMVLRKQTSSDIGFLSDIQVEVEIGVKQQIDFMRQLDEQEDPNFGDADYQLAAYAAALRVLTGYQRIGDIDVEYELNKERKSGEESEIEKIIESAVQVAMDYLVPTGLDDKYWRKLQPEERFYLKGLQIEQGGEYRSGVYTEMARGYGLREYTHLLNTTKANETRLRTAVEFKNKELGNGGFGDTLTRNLLFAIYETYNTEDPAVGRNWLHKEWKGGYWEDRQLMLHLLGFIITCCGHIEHWREEVEAAQLLKGYLENDTAV